VFSDPIIVGSVSVVMLWRLVKITFTHWDPTMFLVKNKVCNKRLVGRDPLCEKFWEILFCGSVRGSVGRVIP